MKSATLMAASMLLAITIAGAPALAQMSSAPMSNSMASDPGMTSPPTASEHGMPAKPAKPMKMTSAEKMKMKSCMKMTPDAMAMDSECGRLKTMKDDMSKNKGM